MIPSAADMNYTAKDTADEDEDEDARLAMVLQDLQHAEPRRVT